MESSLQTDNDNLSNEQADATITIKDLDSGMQQSIDPSFSPNVDQIATISNQSIWGQYWQQRGDLKKLLFRIINSGNTQQLLQVIQQHTIHFDDYEYMDGWSLLHHATFMNRYNIVAILVVNGVNINRQTSSMKRTALHLAVFNNSQQIVELLLDSEADPNIQDADFCTPVHYAIQLSHIRIVKLFLKYKNIDFSLINNKKMTPSDCCRDGRINLLIEQYCGKKTAYSPSKAYLRRYVNVGNNYSMVTKTRADYVQHILGLKSPIITNVYRAEYESDNQSMKKNRNKNSVVGSKINHMRLNFINSMAQQSLCSYHQSLIQITRAESLQDYDIIKNIGSGSFGQVFLARKKQASKLYAIKRLNKKDIIRNKLKKYVYTQRQILKDIHHPFIIHGYSFFQDFWHLYMVMDFCAGGDLEKQTHKEKIPQNIVKVYCCQIILALQHLHNKNYLFRDLKPANVLINDDGHVKLIDFGLAKNTQISYSFLGSVAYLAPQMLSQSDNKMHGPAMDWYLLGVFCYELLTGYPPFYNKNITQMHSDIKNSRPKIPNNVSSQCKNFLQNILIKNPKKRLGYKGGVQIRQHEWFHDITWDDIYNKKVDLPKPPINQKQLRRKQYVQMLCESHIQKMDCFIGWDHTQLNLT